MLEDRFLLVYDLDLPSDYITVVNILIVLTEFVIPIVNITTCHLTCERRPYLVWYLSGILE